MRGYGNNRNATESLFLTHAAENFESIDIRERNV
jgi:hypothetical protein